MLSARRAVAVIGDGCGVVAARRRRRPTRMTPQRCGCCERGGQEIRAPRLQNKGGCKDTSSDYHYSTSSSVLGQRSWNGCTAAQNVTTIQRVPQIDFSKNREKRMEPKEVAPDSEMGRRPICRCLFAALGSIREVDHLTHRILASKMEQMPFVGAVYGKMTRSSEESISARARGGYARRGKWRYIGAKESHGD